MRLLNFFKKQSDLVAQVSELDHFRVLSIDYAQRVIQLETTIKHKNRTIGGYQGAYTRFLNKLKPCCKDCEHLADSLEDV
jgi:hypothetical protein